MANELEVLMEAPPGVTPEMFADGMGIIAISVIGKRLDSGQWLAPGAIIMRGHDAMLAIAPATDERRYVVALELLCDLFGSSCMDLTIDERLPAPVRALIAQFGKLKLNG